MSLDIYPPPIPTFSSIPTVTSLPSSSFDGQVISYVDSLSSPTYRWLFIRNNSSSSSYKWECIGGMPKRVQDDDGRSFNNSSYADMPTDPIVFSLPLAGDWLITIAGNYVVGAGDGSEVFHSYSVGATAASDTWASGAYASPAGAWIIRGWSEYLWTGLAASTELREKIRSSGGGTKECRGHRVLKAMPVRVG